MSQASGPKVITRATIWTAIDFILGRGLNILFIAFLARLLTPEDFGVFALLAIVLGVSAALIESGFGLALIHKQDTTDEDHCTVFWISVVTASILAFLLISAAPSIASFFKIEVLVSLTNVIALTVWVSGFGVVQRALLIKRLAFRQLTIVNLSALTLSSSTAIILAMSGYGVFTLAWQGFVSALVTSLLLWWLNGWRPKALLTMSSARQLFSFGGYLLASRLLDVIYSKSYTLLIGKFYGPLELGFFNRAETIGQLVSGLVVHPISQVAFPAFSKMDGDRARIRSGLKGAIRLSMLLNAITMLTLAAVAKPFVLTLLGPQWSAAVPYLQILCLSSILMPLHVLNLQALMALGRSDLFFLLEVIKKVIGVGILVLASHWGALGVAWGLVVAGFVSFIINSWYSSSQLNLGPFRQLGLIIPSLAFGAIAASAAHLSMLASEFQSPFVLLLTAVSTAATIAVASICLAWLFGLDPSGVLSRSRGEKNTNSAGATDDN